MTPEYILRKSLCRPAHCSDATIETRATRIEDMQYSPEYAEPGYDNSSKAILFANWNYFSNDATDLLEKYGYRIEWEDEWSMCSDCQKAFRISADSYGWQPSYFEMDGELLCIECVNMEDYLETLEDKPTHALNDHVNPEDYGYTQLEDNFENGFHPGQNDNPKEIYKRLRQAGHTRLLFNIDSVGQFDMRFSIWKKQTEE